MARIRIEWILASLIAVALIAGGAGALYFWSTIPVHKDPDAIPATPGVHADRYSQAIDASRRLAHALLLEKNLPGVSIAVARDGDVVWTEAFGWADVEAQQRMTPQTAFHLGSVSKTLTAAAALLLVERGRLDLDAPVQTYVAAYPKKPWPVTTRQLMGDIAGVHRIRGDNNDNPPGGHCAGIDRALETFRDEPLLFEPGTQYRFSNYGWILVSAVVESAAGEPFRSFISKEILTPLHMQDTSLDDAAVQSLSAAYIPRASMRTTLGVRKVAPLDHSCLAGAGAFYSTPSDLARFGSAMLEPGLLKAETIGLLQTPLHLASGTSTNFGLGWKVEPVTINEITRRMVAHRATPNGTSIALLTFPDLGIVVAAAANIFPTDGVDMTGRKIAEAFAATAR